MNEKKEDIRKKLREYALDHYMPVLGFLQAGHFFNQDTSERYQQALEKNFLSSFIKKERSSDLPINDSVYKTVISVVVPYMNPNFYNLTPDQKTGRISASSWGRDYHHLIKELLNDMAEYLSLLAGEHQYMVAVDTVAYSEREIAVQAGLGWIGKNSNLIHPERGSFVFLAELLTSHDIGMEEGSVVMITDHCHECEKCIKACPVNAIDGQHRIIDTRRCLSQQTQEKEKADPFIIKKIKESAYLYGCDICQMVCPYNQKPVAFHPGFLPEDTEAQIPLELMVSISNKEFKKRYGHLAASWRGKKPLADNARIILK